MIIDGGKTCVKFERVIFLHTFFFLMEILCIFSPMASLINLGAISLERMHATFRPFKHRLIKKKIFGAAVAIVWITVGAIFLALSD